LTFGYPVTSGPPTQSSYRAALFLLVYSIRTGERHTGPSTLLQLARSACQPGVGIGCLDMGRNSHRRFVQDIPSGLPLQCHHSLFSRTILCGPVTLRSVMGNKSQLTEYGHSTARSHFGRESIESRTCKSSPGISSRPRAAFLANAHDDHPLCTSSTRRRVLGRSYFVQD